MAINAMVVDDSGIMRKMVMRALSETGLAVFEFTEAKDGMDALEKFDPKSTEMLFVDWNMPNMSGIDFIKKVRETEKHHVPVVMVTTESTMGKVEEAMDEADVDCFVVKPFTPEVLRQKLEPLFEKIKEDASQGGFFSKLASKI
jgi:two-component system chemotaxis response regulator CheY